MTKALSGYQHRVQVDKRDEGPQSVWGMVEFATLLVLKNNPELLGVIVERCGYQFLNSMRSSAAAQHGAGLLL